MQKRNVPHGIPLGKQENLSSLQLDSIFSFFKILLICSSEPHRKRQRHRQREKQAPYRDPDSGLDPRTPGSRPEPKADAQPLTHPGAPRTVSFK